MARRLDSAMCGLLAAVEVSGADRVGAALTKIIGPRPGLLFLCPS